MKDIVFNLVLLIVLSVAFSSLAGCSRPTGNTANSEVAGPPPQKRSSEFPPIPTAVAQAEIKNLDGTTFKVDDLKGKVVLLNLWATWCGPCRSEMPTLVKMQDQYRDKDLEIIGVNTDDEKVEDINKFAADMKLNYRLVWSDTQLQAELLKISKFGGIPQSFLIDRDGHLRGVFKGANPSDVQKMEELVGSVVME